MAPISHLARLLTQLFILLSVLISFPVPSAPSSNWHQGLRGARVGHSGHQEAFKTSVSLPECSPMIGSLSNESTQNTEGPGQSRAWESLTLAPVGEP